MKNFAKIKNKIITSVLVFVLLVFFLSACSDEIQSQSDVFYDFLGTSVFVVIEADADFFWQKKKLNKCFDEIKSLLNHLDEIFSVENKDSVIAKFNQCKRGESVSTNAEFDFVFNEAKEIYVKSDGAFNPSVKMLVDLWAFSKRFSLDDYQPSTAFDRLRNADKSFALPSQKYIDAFVELSQFSFEPQNGQLAKNVDDVVVDDVSYSAQIDLSGVVKGYATDKIKSIIQDYGYVDFYVSIGSSSMFLSSTGGMAYDLAITDPNDVSNDGCCVLKIRDKFVSTSGTYENFYNLEGVKYHHIIDAKTGKPSISDVVSATVFGESGAKADALSTAVVVLGKDRGIELLKEFGYNYVIVTKDNLIFTDLVDGFRIINEKYTENSQ